MNSCSRSTRVSRDEDEQVLLSEKLDDCDFDSASETSEAWPHQSFSLRHKMSSVCSIFRSIYDLRRLLVVPLPRFSSSKTQSENRPVHEEKLHPTAYLDGMRGLAAFAVFMCHLSYGTFDLTHTYNAGEGDAKKDNTSFLQLPGIRLMYSGPPMVAVFFVISGYVLSYKPLRQMQHQDHEALFSTLTSSVFRRALRLFLPCLASTFIVACLAQLGVYSLTEDFAIDMRNISEAHAVMAPTAWIQLRDWVHKMIDFINVFDWSLYSGSVDLDQHLWTIPVEFRCSMALFITHVLVARMRPTVRVMTLCFLLPWGTYWDRWEMVPFWAGALLAQIDLLDAGQESLVGEQTLNAELRSKGTSRLKRAFDVALFLTGLYLASYPDADGHISPGYIQLTKMIPDRCTQKHRFWPNIGAVMIVRATGNLSFLRRTIFESRMMQYLGKISFPLYVCHGFVIHTFGYFVMDWVWTSIGGYEDWHYFQMGFAFSALCIVVMTIWVSDMFLRTVDVRCVRFSRWLEGKLFISR